ncbi:hypothetical protein GCM10017044_02770 [Kordiimonas sediminis]|uniref:DUF4347 domain-containing protein n=1 Tax=Kordiimonas sediminis TaxID=1735581 RepID=A0A919E4U2_9PROT|nr:DUF4347 domain-containing protein [Kordiimonas sediminis]GHF12286.1 hypothetical protein GCM10017044_02770 [Kordiimonas sediminis]
MSFLRQNHPNTESKEILIIAHDVEDQSVLLDGLKDGIAVHHLDPSSPALEQIAAATAKFPAIETLHILSHGAPGQLNIGDMPVTNDTLQRADGAISAIKSNLVSGAKVALWACNIAAEKSGAVFIDTLERLLGANVFASSQPVGAVALGGTWSTGTLVPFSKASIDSYPHTLGVFDGVGGLANATDYTETDSGIDMTVTFNNGTASNLDAGGLGGSTDFVWTDVSGGFVSSVTFTFSAGIDISSFVYFETDTVSPGDYVFTVTNGTGTTQTLTDASFTGSGVVVTPGDWTNVTEFTVTTTATDFAPGFDTLNFTATVTNNNPTQTGVMPVDLTVTEDTASNLDLSGLTLADADGDTGVVLTLTASAGTMAATSGGGVTIGGSGTGT